LNLWSGFSSAVFAAAPFQPGNRSNFHIAITLNLTTQPNAGETASCQQLLLGNGNFFRFAVNEFHAAGRAAGISTAGMQLINVCIFRQREYKPLSGDHFKFPDTVHTQSWHSAIPHKEIIMIARIIPTGCSLNKPPE